MTKKISFFLLVLFLFPALASADTLSNRLKGKILLQVEENGEAWYVSPQNQARYFLGRPADAFQVMRELGLGISNADFTKFENAMPDRLLGMILIKVEDVGKAYYVSPDDKKAYFLGRPADAFQVMREQGLGITNSSLNQIVEDTSSQNRRQAQKQAQTQTQENSEQTTKETTKDEPGANTSEEAASSTEPAIASSTNETVASSTEVVVKKDLASQCEFLAEYFRTENISGIATFSQTEMGVNQNWGVEAPKGLGYIKDKFSVRFTGDCYFEAGTYEFTAVYDDGMKATLDDLWIVKDWNDNKKITTSTKQLEVSEGSHRIKVEYFEYLENAQVSLNWEKIE